MATRRLIEIADLSPEDIDRIWRLADHPLSTRLSGTVGWSFQGNGIRTRTSFIAAFGQLGLSYIELPNLLKTPERAQDLAGYLDPFYSIYVIRESNHQRLMEFAQHSSRPVINAMSSQSHPCEVLTDAYSLQRMLGDLRKVRIGLWGPTTNVFKSWYQLAEVMQLRLYHFCPAEFHSSQGQVTFFAQAQQPVDVLITDGWPEGFADLNWSLTPQHMATLGHPKLIPTPPFSIGKELAFDPVESQGFVGYQQKHMLLAVQRAILMHLLSSP